MCEAMFIGDSEVLHSQAIVERGALNYLLDVFILESVASSKGLTECLTLLGNSNCFDIYPHENRQHVRVVENPILFPSNSNQFQQNR